VSARRSHARGFTLIELMVALALFAMLASILFGSLRLAGRSADAGEEKAQASSGMRLASDYLREQLASQHPQRMRKMLEWNAIDWKARLRGRFRNELGAHAGFTLSELGGELRSVFSQIDDATLDYYLAQYPNRARTVRMLHGSGLGTFAFPSIYFSGQKH
jgi:prepilin-type N-terminal cleavage/methylation domain-containing protein